MDGRSALDFIFNSKKDPEVQHKNESPVWRRELLKDSPVENSICFIVAV
jgi:hypothetical protein